MNTGQYYEVGTWRQLVSPNGTGVTLNPQKTALIVVDVQRKNTDRHARRGLVHQFFKIDAARAEDYFSNLERKVVPNIRRLLDFCRARNMPVIYFVVGGTAPDGNDRPYSVSWPHRLTDAYEMPALILSSDPDFEVIEELRPQDGEYVIHKFTVGGFTNTPVDLLLRNLGMEEVVLVGGATQGCVESTGRGAADLGFKVAIVEDAVTSGALFDGTKVTFVPPFLHDATMVNFASIIGRVTTTEELLHEWGSYSPGRAAEEVARPASRA